MVCRSIGSGGKVDVSHGKIAIGRSHYQQGLHLIEGPAPSYRSNMSPQEMIMFMRGWRLLLGCEMVVIRSNSSRVDR